MANELNRISDVWTHVLYDRMYLCLCVCVCECEGENEKKHVENSTRICVLVGYMCIHMCRVYKCVFGPFFSDQRI